MEAFSWLVSGRISSRREMCQLGRSLTARAGLNWAEGVCVRDFCWPCVFSRFLKGIHGLHGSSVPGALVER